MSNSYTGPYWSDGKLQSSVEFGKTPPGSALDAESRLHDSAYAHYQDLQHRMAADEIYEMNTRNLGTVANAAGKAVVYGNQTIRSGMNLGTNVMKYGPLGLIVGAVQNAYNLYDYMVNEEKYVKEVKAYYDTDPIHFKQSTDKQQLDLNYSSGNKIEPPKPKAPLGVSSAEGSKPVRYSGTSFDPHSYTRSNGPARGYNPYHSAFPGQNRIFGASNVSPVQVSQTPGQSSTPDVSEASTSRTSGYISPAQSGKPSQRDLTSTNANQGVYYPVFYRRGRRRLKKKSSYQF